MAITNITRYAYTLPGKGGGDAVKLFAVDNGTIVGIASVRDLHTGTPYVADVHVLETRRGHGVGTALVQHAINEARSQGKRRIALWVDEENARAQKLYESIGFEQVAEPHQNNIQMCFQIKGAV